MSLSRGIFKAVEVNSCSGCFFLGKGFCPESLTVKNFNGLNGMLACVWDYPEHSVIFKLKTKWTKNTKKVALG